MRRVQMTCTLSACLAGLFAGPTSLLAQTAVRSVASVTTTVPGLRSGDTVDSVSHCGQWLSIETPSFRIWTRLDREQAVALARRCEKVRDELRMKWLPETASDSWMPKTELVVHPTATDYARALGQPGGGSSGTTAVTVEGDRVVRRRVDLRADAAEWSSSSLPHELTHLVLADHFAGRQLPRWADEGIAVLSESGSKQDERRRSAANTSSLGKLLPLSDLLTLRDYPAPEKRSAFYCQSASLVEFMVARAGAERFLQFIEKAMEVDYDAALKDVYQIDGVRGLQSEWNLETSIHPFPQRVGR
jgi:hypothetical protein